MASETTRLKWLSAAGKNDDDIAEDDPEAIRLMKDYLDLGDYALNSMMKDPRYDLSTKTSDNLVELRVNAQQTPFAGVMDGVQVEQLEEHGRVDNMETTSTDARNDDESRRTDKLKRRQGKARLAAQEVLYPASEIRSATSHFLVMHAKVYAAAAKYTMFSLMKSALDKFKSGPEGTWARQDVIAEIPVVYRQTTEIHTGMRGALRALILEDAHSLVSDSSFCEAIEKHVIKWSARFVDLLP
ncbi:hypothetical protein LTR56_025022 [Elasticomyces elasticus]|nr:hypothetical protein LTR56_025022 [Elasticomyces elasticus]KAK3621352.1 hypothetical protein LTR22_025232 [Elasticomyces elasticus]KAK4904044.1 hypothetical protein LTR49_026439 [Elasticomyces elasticus]